MKKISLFAFVLMAGFAANAQTVNFGLKGGLNIASWDHSENETLDSRLGYHAGLFANIPVSPQISIQPEAIYSSQGIKYMSGNTEHSLALNYVNIPVMVQANVGRGFYAEAGPQVGILTGTADKVNDQETGFFTTDDFKKTDVSLGVGVGYKGLSGFGVGARYNLGLTNINNVGTANIKNNVFQVGLMMQLGGTGKRF